MAGIRTKGTEFEGFQVPTIGPIAHEAPAWWSSIFAAPPMLLRPNGKLVEIELPQGKVIEGLDGGALIGAFGRTLYAGPGHWIFRHRRSGDLTRVTPEDFAANYEAV
ncbi:hypothetical protein [Jiella avicenniae]|uniref:Uncharacterized protein n=1 Tax=Jiella avicenniae TaxID=2907202 RepID=A0A9X1NZ76_9HYPH|nr:hypothetical protein [Jiella avicenniae]MCE7026403.1 hypothetical protein [Jiella avicenniae]